MKSKTNQIELENLSNYFETVELEERLEYGWGCYDIYTTTDYCSGTTTCTITPCE